MSEPAREPDAARAPQAARGPRARPDGTPVTVVHVVRHGEVHNPDGVLYGQLPGYHLSERGRQMARAAADSLADADITYVVASPLERAQETAEPFAAAHGLAVAVDDRLIESANHFQGLQVGTGDGALWRRRHWKAYTNPFAPSWGEPYAEIAVRMTDALEAARARAEGHEAVMVSHQLPVWTLRRSLERRRLWHHPRRRECSLASVTSVTFHGDDPVSIDYAEPARHLLAGALDVTGTSGRVIR